MGRTTNRLGLSIQPQKYTSELSVLTPHFLEMIRAEIRIVLPKVSKSLIQLPKDVF